ncbi:MAG: TlpA family protein disulfide reductase [Bacteroidia bacterium]|nr:TlpA family protein disulfide reductase [Bacteroidia bacterium]
MLLCGCLNAQQIKQVYKIDGLLKRLHSSDSTYVVNFWATWCKPCVQELPGFDSLAMAMPHVKVLLVCLDFKEELGKKVNPFLLKKGIKSECVLLDEVNGNDFVDKISPKWSGAIPATYFVKGNKREFVEKKLHLNELLKMVNDLK